MKHAGPGGCGDHALRAAAFCCRRSAYTAAGPDLLLDRNYGSRWRSQRSWPTVAVGARPAVRTGHRPLLGGGYWAGACSVRRGGRLEARGSTTPGTGNGRRSPPSRLRSQVCRGCPRPHCPACRANRHLARPAPLRAHPAPPTAATWRPGWAGARPRGWASQRHSSTPHRRRGQPQRDHGEHRGQPDLRCRGPQPQQATMTVTVDRALCDTENGGRLGAGGTQRVDQVHRCRLRRGGRCG